jgi:hypothetical protein
MYLRMSWEAPSSSPTAAPEPERVATVHDVANLLNAAPIPAPTEETLLIVLAAAVDFARYWQEPDGEDMLAADPAVRAPLARIATVLLASPHALWWFAPLNVDAQWEVRFLDEQAPVPVRSLAAREALERWRTAQVEEETTAARERPADPHARWSGTWWSRPPYELTHTTRVLSEQGPAGLWLVEDSLGWDQADAIPIEIHHNLRVFVIDGPEAWAELCRRYPLNVTASRRHDWFRATGRDGQWVIPDWVRVSGDFGGIHLTVAGYLTTAGRAIEVSDTSVSVLAGWNPDETYWLRDVDRFNSATPQTWRFDSDTVDGHRRPLRFS